MHKGTGIAFAACVAATCATNALAGFVGFETSGGYVNGKFVCRIYAKFNSPNDVVLSCFGIQGFANSEWNDSDFANGTWNPQFAIDGAVDSYVTIGGTTGFANSTAADPAWGGAGFTQSGIPNGAGWFNSNPPNLQGKVDGTLRTLIAQFVYPDAPTQSYNSPLTVSFNQGLGTPTQFSTGATFTLHIPAPAGLPLASVAMLVVGRGRRRRS
jgi:hypothetical protein